MGFDSNTIARFLNELIVLTPGILIGLTFHEWAHAYMAYRLGDSTAKRMGRLTLNPMAHLDPYGTIMIIFIKFGWAKPVPVDARNLRNPKRDMLLISAAGPLMNVGLAIVAAIVLRITLAINHSAGSAESSMILLTMMLAWMVRINLGLALFNLLPIPPLDGSKILYGLLPNRYAPMIYAMETRGPIVLFGIIMFGFITGFHIFGYLISPFVYFFYGMLTGI